MTNLYKHSKTDLLSETSFTNTNNNINTDNYTSSVLNSLLYNEYNEQSGGFWPLTNTKKQTIPATDLNHKDIRLVREFMRKYSEKYIQEMTRILKELNGEMNDIYNHINKYETQVKDAQKIKAPQKAQPIGATGPPSDFTISESTTSK
jgi:hypothetical protein